MSLSLSNKMRPPTKRMDVLRSRRGISLLEVVIAMFLTTIAVMAIMSLQPAAWKTAGRADYMGRAAGILYKELQRQEACIMNSNNTVNTGTTGPTPVFAGGGTAAQTSGDAQFNVTTTITSDPTTANVWIVTVRVTWAGHATGISESLVVTRQEPFSCPTCNVAICR